MNQALYQENILDHYRNPRCHGSLPAPTHQGDGLNASCGDKLHMDISVGHDTIEAIRFHGAGCAISQASASLLAEFVQGKSVSEVRLLSPDAVIALLGVTLSPSRMKCGLLSLETLHQTLASKDVSVK